MHWASSLRVTSDFRRTVAILAERLNPVRVQAGSRWQAFAAQLDLASSTDPRAAIIVVDTPASVLRYATANQAASAPDFGFVMPVAQKARWWQRARSWEDAATLDLWDLGWSPLTIDRLALHTPDAQLEFVIGSARRNPEPRFSDPT